MGLERVILAAGLVSERLEVGFAVVLVLIGACCVLLRVVYAISVLFELL